MRSIPVAALALAAVLAVLAGCGSATNTTGGRRGDGGHGAGTGRWSRLPTAPLSARDGPVLAVVAGRLIVMGGYAGPACPPSADCAAAAEPERDGAAYDPVTRAWRPIADAPQGVPEWSRSAVIGDRLYVLVDDALLAWGAARDTWKRIVPPHGTRGAALAVSGTALVLVRDSNEHGVHPDQVLDTTTGQWSTLPADPLEPAYDRTITWTPAGLVLTASEIDEDGNPVDPSLAHAALLAPGAETWRVLPVTGQLGEGPWTWTGRRLVAATVGGSDGGEVGNYGGVLPYGGRLDPVTGTWSPLPDAPSYGSSGWAVDAASGGPVIATSGWLYDDGAGTWTALPRPPGAPDRAGPGVWMGDDLLVYGGGSWVSENGTQELVRSTGFWSYRLR
jgi:hypothetical protein